MAINKNHSCNNEIIICIHSFNEYATNLMVCLSLRQVDPMLSPEISFIIQSQQSTSRKLTFFRCCSPLYNNSFNFLHRLYKKRVF